MNNCVIYARFSSHGQNEQSIDGQVRICTEFAESKGLKVVKVYTEKAKTGTNDSRPTFQKMIADANSGAFNYIIVYMFDRFARNRRDSIMYKEMLKERYGIRVLSALEPIADDEGGEFYEMFLDWNAEKYSKRLSKRVRDGLDTSVLNGTFCGGTLIYGYKIIEEPINGKPNKAIKKVAINDEEAKIVKFAFEEYAKGTTKKEIAEKLNKEGYRLRGKPFDVKSFDRWLVNRKYTGEFIFGGRQCNNTYPKIIENDIFEKVQERLNKNKFVAGGQATAKIPYLLTGKLFCGHCGTEMIADVGTSKLGKKLYYYACKKKRKNTCDKKRENKDALELYVTNCVRDFLSNKQNAEIAVTDVLNYFEKKTDETNIISIKNKIAQINKEVEELANAFVKAKSSLLQATNENKMTEYEHLLSDLYLQQSQLELERSLRITKKDLLDFIQELLNGNPDDKEYQKKLIDNLVYQVYVSDDNTVVYFNINGGKSVETISFDTIKSTTTDIVGVRTQLPLSCQYTQNKNSEEFLVILKDIFGLIEKRK